MLIWMFALSLMAQSPDAGRSGKPETEVQRDALVKEAWRIYEKKDSFAVVEFLNKQDNRLLAVDAWSQLVNHAYWEKKDLTAVATLGESGIGFALEVARETEAASPEKAAGVRGVAKAIAYNIASFTWPGWGEPGITVTGRDLALGMDAARANLRWARELEKGDLALSRAFWMIGAHELAAGNHAEARRNFETAEDLSEKAGAEGERLMNHGYALISIIVENPNAEDPRKRFDESKEQLAGQEDGQFYVDQLNTALEVFTK